MEFLTKRIAIDDSICNGKPIIRGLRITVQSILEYLGAGETEEEILAQFPDLVKEDIKACLQFASEMMNRSFTIKGIAA